jgi:hypothetical protein
LEAFPTFPGTPGPPVTEAPPAPIVTGIALPALPVNIFENVLTPPAPPPPPLSEAPAPPPPTTKASMSVVPGCAVTVPVEVLVVTVHLPKLAELTLPMTPPFPELDLLLGIQIFSYDQLEPFQE